MCTIKLQADDGTFIVKQGENPTQLAAAGTEESTALELVAIKTGGHGTPDPTKMMFQAGNDFVSLDGEDIILSANSKVSNREFIVVWVGCNKIALKAENNLYVSRETLGSNTLQANRDQIGPWETFTVIEVS